MCLRIFKRKPCCASLQSQVAKTKLRAKNKTAFELRTLLLLIFFLLFFCFLSFITLEGKKVATEETRKNSLSLTSLYSASEEFNVPSGILRETIAPTCSVALRDSFIPSNDIVFSNKARDASWGSFTGACIFLTNSVCARLCLIMFYWGEIFVRGFSCCFATFTHSIQPYFL